MITIRTNQVESTLWRACAWPELRASSLVLSREGFAEVVRGGAKRPRGMPSFDSLSDERLLALQHYIREQVELAQKRD